MQPKLVHALTLAGAVLGGVAAGIYGIVGQLPAAWQQPVLVGLGIASLLGSALSAGKVVIASTAATHDSKVQALNAGLSPQEAVNFAHNDTPTPVAAEPPVPLAPTHDVTESSQKPDPA